MAYFKNYFRIFCSTILLFPLSNHFGQTKNSSSEILQALNKLNVLGSALYIAAHPDDENTAVLTYLSKGKLFRTGYLSLTRGDGGQNLLGNEKGDLLGVVRTQELLSARKLDGAEQFFTRAIDFGYSKTPEETLNNWDREKILSDVVKVVRQFKPDIILTRFSKTQGGHGHHLSSAILAEEAFYAAADPNKFTEQLKQLDTWQAKRLYWNTFVPSPEALAIDIGEYNPVIGKSYSEIAAGSRSMHKSQGFGVSPGRGKQQTLFDYFAGDSAKSDLFSDMNYSWSRIKGGIKIQKEIDEIIKKYNPEAPEEIVKNLVNLDQQLESTSNNYWINAKRKEVKRIIQMCLGIWMEAIVWQPGVSPGEAIDVRTMIVNRSNTPLTLEKISTTYAQNDSLLNTTLEYNSAVHAKMTSKIPLSAEYSQPYWLREKHDGKMFNIKNKDQIGSAENGHVITTKFHLNIYGRSFIYEVPARYRWTDAVKGEQFRPLVVRPEVSVAINQPTFVFTNGKTHEINVSIKTKINNSAGSVYLSMPEDWKCEPKEFNFDLKDKEDQSNFTFKVSSNGSAKSGMLKAVAQVNGKTYSEEIIEIDYSHIPHQTVLQPAEAKLILLDVSFDKKHIGYIMGSGDEIPLALKQLGYTLDLLSDEDLDNKDLSIYDVIICGIRAFNTREELGRQQKRLLEFTENGGTWIVQHNTRFGSQVNQIGPYPFKATGRDRIADETAPLEILMPEHQIFNSPNKISEKDFENWVQERGLYFAETWDGKLNPLLAGNDKGENSKLGGLLYANYGKGVFIFTAYSWFRQLPAGVPGAYRLFVNLISAKGKK